MHSYTTEEDRDVLVNELRKVSRVEYLRGREDKMLVRSTRVGQYSVRSIIQLCTSMCSIYRVFIWFWPTLRDTQAQGGAPSLLP